MASNSTKGTSFDNKSARWVLAIGILLMIINPWLLTRSLGWVDFSKTGEIGDTVGGITAPIVNLMGAVLVYFAFTA